MEVLDWPLEDHLRGNATKARTKVCGGVLEEDLFDYLPDASRRRTSPFTVDCRASSRRRPTSDVAVAVEQNAQRYSASRDAAVATVIRPSLAAKLCPLS